MALTRKLPGVLVLIALTLAFLAAPAAQAAEAKKVLIKSVKEVGTKVVLMDGSEWSIENPADQEMVYDWLPFQTVVVKDGKVLVNLHRGDIVDAKMTKAPTAPAQAATGAAATTTASAGAAQSSGGTQSSAAAPGTKVVVSEDLVNRMDKILNRLEDLEFSVKSIEMRLMRLERMAGVVP